MPQLKDNKKDGLRHISALAEKETALLTGLLIRNPKHSSKYSNANKKTQMGEWAYKEYFAAAIINEATGKIIEYKDLTKKHNLKELWQYLLVNKVGRLAQDTRH